MINPPATKFVAAVLIIAGLVFSPGLDRNDESEPINLIAKAVMQPQFQITLQPGTLTLSGHTATRQHELDLLKIASTAYKDRTLTSDFQPLGLVPEYWHNVSTEALLALAETTSATAVLTANELTITGISIDSSAWHGGVDSFRRLLPDDLSLLLDIRIVDPEVSIVAICERAFAMHETGAITFLESSANFRSSAYPRLARVIALARACPNSRISITGHTDSSGNEAWNKHLSLQRATAVGDFLIQGGIDESRLSVSGIGSTVPLADNATRYGRSLNRRIEIALSND